MRFAIMILTAAGIILLLAGNASAQQPPFCQPWLNQSSWSGTMSIQGAGQVVDSQGDIIKVNESATMTFTTDNSALDCAVSLLWTASPAAVMTYSVTINDEIDMPCGDGRLSGTTYQVTNGTSIARALFLVIDPVAGTYNLTMPPTADNVHEVSTLCDGTKVSDFFQQGWVYGPNTDSNKNSFQITNVPLPGTGLTLSGIRTIQAPANGLELFLDPPISWTVTWNLTPKARNLDLTVTIPTLGQWRPAGGKTEKDIGTDPVTGLSTLQMSAQLVDKDTGELVQADKITFSLKGVSSEPGVSMNWPPASVATTDPDLSFDKQNNPLATLSNNGATADFVPPDGSPVSAVLSPHDWGGWATLNVSAMVGDQTVTGHLSTDSTVTDILLPKRQSNSHIADIWKTQHGVSLSTADSDDSETDPVGEPGCIGDGLTLYEEYRGFMENGKHIEGDPATKDFFIQNFVGGDAEPGIFLFTATTGLNVHKDIQLNEMDTTVRQINFNHGQGAQEVAQHGVIITTCPDVSGGLTGISESGVHGRPGLTIHICMEPRSEATGRTSNRLLGPGETHNGVISVSDALSQFDIAVAHELSHSVGVNHHGEGDQGNTRFTLLGPNDPRNSTDQPNFFMNGPNTLVHFLDEATGADRASVMWDNLLKNLATVCPDVSALYSPSLFSTNCQAFVNGAVPLFTDLVLWIGFKNAQHSGNDQCMMRYFFANSYQKTGDATTYYITTSGTEPSGTNLCPTPAGTGINGSGHSPQPRYFDATVGACQTWVCVNDNIPPKEN